MTTQDETEVPGDDQELPPDEQESEAEATPPQPSKREQELEGRLRRQGNELATQRRINQTLTDQITNVNSRVEQLAGNMSARDKADDERRQAELTAYLDSLPSDQRLKEELRLTQDRLARVESRQAAPPARTSAPQTRQETPQQYQARRAREILQEAADTFGVPISRDDIANIPAEAWDDEQDFQRAAMRLAGSKQSPAARRSNEEDEDVAGKKSNKETPDNTADGVRKQVLRDLGVSTTASPRAAASRRAAVPTSDEVRATVSTYDSRSGPKANIARLKAQREKMG